MDEMKESDVFVAPGSKLNLTANVKNDCAFAKSKVINGLDWGSNSCRRIVDSITRNQVGPNIYQLKGDSFFIYLNKVIRTGDSLADQVFTNDCVQSFSSEFAHLVHFDNFMSRLYFLTYHLTYKIEFNILCCHEKESAIVSYGILLKTYEGGN